jgi:hypothetical protein
MLLHKVPGADAVTVAMTAGLLWSGRRVALGLSDAWALAVMYACEGQQGVFLCSAGLECAAASSGACVGIYLIHAASHAHAGGQGPAC